MLLFLVAILVGVCSLARYEDTHVVEPCILMTAAYSVGLQVPLWILCTETWQPTPNFWIFS